MARYRMKHHIGSCVIGGHSFTAKGPVVVNRQKMAAGSKIALKAGDVIECKPFEVEGAIEKFECLEEEAEPKPSIGLLIKQREGGELAGYDVIHPVTKEPINGVPLTLDEAKSLASDFAPDDPGPQTSAAQKGPGDPAKEPYQVVKRPGGNLTGFDVSKSASGEAVNEKMLRKDEAAELCQKLNAEAAAQE